MKDKRSLLRLCAIACLSVLLLIGFSCIQEEDIETSMDQGFSPEIQKVKSWYEKNKVLLHPKPGSAHAREFGHDLILPFFEKEPDWEDFYSYQFPDGRQVFEVHLKNLTGIMPTAFMEKYGSQADDLTEESLLFIENPQIPDGFVPVVARYFSEGQQSEEMTYHQIPLGWTGRIDLLTYDERHLRSIKVENGQLISHIRYQTEEPRVSSRAYSSYTSCQPGYWVDFPYYAMEEGIGVESQQSVWVQECYTNTYETEEPETSSPQVGGGGTSSPPPSSTTPEEEDICEEEFCIPFPEEDRYFETTNTPDDGFNFQGEKVKIPTTLILQNGDQIKIEFGITQSDRKSANQEVAKLLLEGIKHAIEKANLKLSGNEKITSIYIAATTNGTHGPGSNHYNGTAIDISRINGVKMSVSGITNQIIQLQIAMDNFPNVRENFGPHFKHKFSIETGKWNYSHPVGGHSDHIHFSVR
ncbi:hypothetical protein [Algoriphagus hitonicola]|uniref:hypothetical protein n=1 Tax=Algoriphagus hitonicola TaxID=435880 RepID=UPI00116145CE|nr:hypothetical protein [Algoriphagus hitonicola]